MSYRAIQRGLCCTIASRENLISFICDIQAASLNLTAKLLSGRTRQPTRGQWLLSGKLRRSIATLGERRLWDASTKHQAHTKNQPEAGSKQQTQSVLKLRTSVQRHLSIKQCSGRNLKHCVGNLCRKHSVEQSVPKHCVQHSVPSSKTTQEHARKLCNECAMEIYTYSAHCKTLNHCFT